MERQKKRAVFRKENGRVFIEADEDQIMSVIQDKDHRRETIPGFIKDASAYIIFNNPDSNVHVIK